MKKARETLKVKVWQRVHRHQAEKARGLRNQFHFVWDPRCDLPLSLWTDLILDGIADVSGRLDAKLSTAELLGKDTGLYVTVDKEIMAAHAM